MHTPRVVIWTTSDPETTRAELARRPTRPRLLVPVAHGTFVLGPHPYTSESLIDGLRVVKGRRIGLVWTETTAWLVYFDGVVRGWRFGPDDFFEPESPKRLPEGLSWLGEAAEAVRERGVLDGVSALRTALEAAGFFSDAAALVRIDGGEVDEAVPYHEKKWWEGLAGERQGMSDQPWVNPLLPLGGTLLVSVGAAFLLTMAEVPALITVPLYLLMVAALAMRTGIAVVAWSRGRRVDAFPARDVLGMSAWAREADQE
ncbi:hypothetical protein [Lentzea sp. NEAU-D7]|uniref:hypothetical protein n=1 Tax=Lentzea sp. NEAU-D7 TaxID=2994667 RepID=UPI00224A9CD4|nr:hypothetical protein [Lentzea sp. NEAU-D7]MCX2955033.1 hypothetical protein [Lentzea sp. NEAU-D7]